MIDRHWRALACALALLLATSASLTGPQASADDPSDPPPTGSTPLTPLPAVTAAAGLTTIVSSSETHVAILHEQGDFADGASYVRVYRLSDGTFVRRLPRGELDGGSLTLVRGDARWSSSNLVVHDVETGAITWDVVLDGKLVASGAQWAIYIRIDGSIHFSSRAGVTSVLPFSHGSAPVVHSVDRATGVAYFHASDGVWWQLDLTTGVTAAGSAPPTISTPHRDFVQDTYVKENWTWTSRDGSGSGQVQVVEKLSPAHRVVGFGDRLAVLVPSGDDDRPGLGVRPVDLTTGELEPPVATGVVSAEQRSDGGLLVMSREGRGHLSVLRDQEPATRVLELDQLYRPLFGEHDGMANLTLDGGVVFGRWPGQRTTDGIDRFADLAATLGGDQDWAATTPAGLTLPTSHDDLARSAIVQTTAGGYLERVGTPQIVFPQTYRLVAPTGTREVEAMTAPVIGRGDRLLRRLVEGQSGEQYWRVEDLRTGARLLDVDPAWGVALDGTWVWQATSAGKLVGVDTASGLKREVSIPACNLVDPGGIRGRWALLYCPQDVRIIDLSGKVAPWILPMSTTHLLGHGFVAWVDWTKGSSGHPIGTLWVGDLNGSRALRNYGLAGNVAVDRTDRTSLVFSDRFGLAREADLSWLGKTPPPDTTAPTVTSTAISATVLRAPTGYVTHRTAGRDDRGAVSFETAFQRAGAGQRLSAWLSPGGAWRASASVSTALSAGQAICFRSRVHDRAGNSSAWSQPRCASAPYDDRQLVPKGKVARRSASAAMSRTETRLLRRNSQLATRTAQRGRRVELRAICAPRQGSVRVYIGGTLLGTVNLSCKKATVIRRTLGGSVERFGVVTIRSTSVRTARIDGVAVLR